jgi:hypothetical protein
MVGSGWKVEKAIQHDESEQQSGHPFYDRCEKMNDFHRAKESQFSVSCQPVVSEN